MAKLAELSLRFLIPLPHIMNLQYLRLTVYYFMLIHLYLKHIRNLTNTTHFMFII